MKKLLKLLIKSQSSQGWTLLELIIASCLTLTVVGVSGFGLLAILKSNKIASANSRIQYDLNRAIEFMSNEVKSANLVELNPYASYSYASFSTYIKDSTKYTGFDGFNPPGTFASVMFLKLPDLDTNGKNVRVVYYTRTKDSSIPWIQPKIIYRWGPPLKVDGTYNLTVAPANWDSSYQAALIDAIANTPSNGANTCKNTTWTSIPDTSTPNGFYICVSSDKKMAEIHVFGSATVNTKKDPVSYSVETQVYTRAN